jgi:trans-aconitate methyltransferase
MEDLFTYTDSWKNKDVFEDQLRLNQQELDNYPLHWRQFIEILSHFKTDNLLDVGCGVGAMSELCAKELPQITYTGIDYSEDAINIAKTHWPKHSWYVKNYTDLTKEFVAKFDTLHAGAFLDVLPNGDDVLDLILSLGVNNVLIGRAKITEKPSYFETYAAYNKITTYAYYHNKDNLARLAKKHGYSLSLLGVQDQCNLIFQKNQ